MVVGLPHRDTQCGFKLYRKDAARALFGSLALPRFSHDIEVLARAKERGLRVVEVGVVFAHDDRSHVKPRDFIQGLFDIFRIRFGLSRHAPLLQLLRFMTVGVLNTLIDTGIYITLTRLAGLDSIVAAKLLSFLAATVSSLLLNRYWTFGITSALTVGEVARFYATVSASMVLNVGLMYTLVHVMGLYDLAALVLTTLSTFALNYALSRRWVFARA
jgi:putative flippase GtrA